MGVGQERYFLRLKWPSGVFYGWWLVGITVFTLAVILGPAVHSMGLFFVALERQFHWSRTIISGAFALQRAEGALLGPLEGYLADRLGTRWMVLTGMLILGMGFIGLSQIHNVISLYVAFAVIFMGAGVGGFIPLIAAINHWFVQHRTMAMALGNSGASLGGLLTPGLALAILHYGWRPTAVWIGVAILVLAVPISSLLRNRPEDYGLRPDGEPLGTGSSEVSLTIEVGKEMDQSFTVRDALRTMAFWAITASHSLAIIAAATIGVHIVPAMTDIGMSVVGAGLVVTTFTFTSAMAQLVGGLAGDRFPKPPVIATFMIIQGIGLMVKAVTTSVAGAFWFAILYGIGQGGRIPVLMAIRGDYFGRKNFATLFGISLIPMNLLGVGAPIAAGYLFDTLGSYQIPFLSLVVSSLVGATLILLARKPALPSLNNLDTNKT